MFAWLRRHQPRGVVPAILYWAAITVAGFAALFALFFYVVDPLLPAMY